MRELDDIAFTTAHEIGHILLGGGHPDEGGGIAPLESLTLDLHKIRLMCSGPNRVVGSSRMLIKTEWDRGEQWLIDTPDTRQNESE